MTRPPAAPRLSPAKLRDVRATLTAHIEVDVPAPKHTGNLPGAVDYHVTFKFDWYRANGGPRPVDRDFEILTTLAHEQGLDPNDAAATLTIGAAHLLIVDIYEPQLLDTLNSRNADLRTLVTALLMPHGQTEPNHGTALLPEVVDRVELIGSHAILIDTIHVRPEFRGGQLGLLATGAALDELRRGCVFAALQARQPRSADRDSPGSLQHPSTYWRHLGFEPLHSEVMLLSLAHVTFDNAMAALRDRAAGNC